ncbi:MAG: ATP-binding protein [Candidatus Paceibacterota bacterium]
MAENIENWLFKGKVIILYGPRQVGKTTLVKELVLKHGDDRSYINCEILENQQALAVQNPAKLKTFLGPGRFFVFDEAQKVDNIGLALKLLIDTYPDLQVIATGSSSFDLSAKVNEPLTGRSIEFKLYPISYEEISDGKQEWEISAVMESMLVYGSYPEIIKNQFKDAETALNNISSNYLFKDIFEYEGIKKPKLLTNLLQLLALQVGNEVSLNELSIKLETSRKTVAKYIDLLEKTFVIFTLYPLSRNPRNEIGRKNKIYFYDLGIRNNLIGRVIPLSKREDIGALWENFCVVERKKYLECRMRYGNQFFWRNTRGKEVDYIEEGGGIFSAYEFKWSEQKTKFPKDFIETYKPKTELIHKGNIKEFLLDRA